MMKFHRHATSANRLRIRPDARKAEANTFEMLRNYVRTNDAVSFQIQVGTPLMHDQDGVTARLIEERAFPREPLTVAQLKGRHLPQPAVRFLAALREAMIGVEPA